MTDAASTPSTQPESGLAQTLKRCRPEVLTAALAYRDTKDASQLPVLVVGVLERYMDPEKRGILAVDTAAQHELKIQADLGVDSLTMVEVVMTFEEVLGDSIPDTELRGLVTIGDTLAYIDAKATGKPLPVPPERIIAEMLPLMLGEGTAVLIQGIILRANKAEAVYAGTDAASAETLAKAASQLQNVWVQKLQGKTAEQVGTIDTKVTNAALTFEADKPVQIILQTANGVTTAQALQTGKPVQAFAQVTLKA